MIVDDNMLADMWAHLKTVLARSADLLRMLLDKIDMWFRKSLLSMLKHYKNLFSCARAQLVIIINIRNIIPSVL